MANITDTCIDSNRAVHQTTPGGGDFEKMGHVRKSELKLVMCRQREAEEE